MPEDGAKLGSAPFQGCQLLLGDVPAAFGRRHSPDGLAKPGFRLRSQPKGGLFLLDAEIEHDRRAEPERRHLRGPSGPSWRR